MKFGFLAFGIIVAAAGFLSPSPYSWIFWGFSLIPLGFFFALWHNEKFPSPGDHGDGPV